MVDEVKEVEEELEEEEEYDGEDARTLLFFSFSFCPSQTPKCRGGRDVK